MSRDPGERTGAARPQEPDPDTRLVNPDDEPPAGDALLDIDDVGDLDADELDVDGGGGPEAVEAAPVAADSDLEVAAETEPAAEPPVEPAAETEPERTDREPAAETDPEPPVEVEVGFEPDGDLLADPDGYRQRWQTIQVGFVDEPSYAVESASQLLAAMLDELTSTLAAKRNELESEWRHRDQASTEEARAAFQTYRSFFDRVISL